MLAILLATFPFFALVLAGFVATHRGLLPQGAIPGLNAFVLYFALPCMLYRFGATTPIADYLNAAVVGVWVACAAILIVFTVATTLSRRVDWNNAAFGALVASFPNTGYLGVGLLAALLGPQAAAPAIVTILVDLVFTSSTCIALSRLGAGGGGAGAAVARALRGIVANPLPWAILLGVATSTLGVRLPTPVMQTVSLLADAASPVALFTIGAVLARSQLDSRDRTPLVEYVPVALKKLLLHPLLVYVVGRSAIELGAPLDPFALQVMVLCAALPSASNVAMLAERYGANNGRIARIILVSTALAFLTFSGAVSLMS
ncbi:MAG TPA: AEC family transporter [Casimicrobiaceae bacterium]|nr:AEC family transporter [Casimicrobiaceae bacterium]